MPLLLGLLLIVFCSLTLPVAAQEPIVKRGAPIDIRQDKDREIELLSASRGETIIRVPVRYNTLVKVENNVTFTGGLVKGTPIVEAGAYLYLTETHVKQYSGYNSLTSVDLDEALLCAAPSASQKRKFNACFTVKSIDAEETVFLKGFKNSWLQPFLATTGYFGGGAVQLTGPVTENPFPDLTLEVQVTAWRADSMSWRMLLGGERVATGKSPVVDGKATVRLSDATISLFGKEFIVESDHRGSFTPTAKLQSQ